MASTKPELLIDVPNLFRLYKDGTIERLTGNEIFPPSTNLITGVQSKDVVIDEETGISARIYVPKTTNPDYKKLPLLMYFHGGGFLIETAFSPTYHNYLDPLAAKAHVVIVSVDYKRAPEHHLPIAYDDSWAAIKWVAAHYNQGGPKVWLNDYVDFNKVFFARDSAGGNIAHNMAVQVGIKNPEGSNLVGLDPNFSKLGCDKVLVCVAEKDILRDRGWYYKEELEKSGWGGVVEVMEAEGENHVFHLFNPTCDKAVAMLKRLAAFMN
ncbi:hypothetical protein Vadar_007367 [Vaccinium darrowii]|uniref:Uncharacterized protein n=1 Tax=Vaccinium darrowii TaxID=229202 RepID=A0ACB7WZ18_9ERIC|nr:hypothetical protein Vadar_007367 [Vaccinium darrowii]